MLDYLTNFYFKGTIKKEGENEVRFVSDEIIEIGKEITSGIGRYNINIIKPISEIIEQRPAMGTWKVRPTFYHVSVVAQTADVPGGEM